MKPKVVDILINPQKLANALWLDREQVIEEFTDGRVIARFSEHWAAKLYGFQKTVNTNDKHDGVLTTMLRGQETFSVRCLSKNGVKFQRSCEYGAGRKGTNEQMKKYLETIDYVVIVDIVNFPFIRLMPVQSNRLVSLVDQGGLTTSGLSYNSFYKKLYKLDKSKFQADFIIEHPFKDMIEIKKDGLYQFMGEIK